MTAYQPTWRSLCTAMLGFTYLALLEVVKETHRSKTEGIHQTALTHCDRHVKAPNRGLPDKTV